MSRVLAILGLLLATAPTFAASRAPAPPVSGSTGNLVVGVKEPVTAAEAARIAKALPAKLVRVAYDGRSFTVAVRAGVTPEKIKARSSRIAYVEKEILMGATFRTEDARLAKQ